jgi:hypothetical protein
MTLQASEDHDRKLTAAFAQMADAGLQPSHFNPLGDRLLRKLGCRLRPPHYRHPFMNAAAMGLWFACLWGAGMWIFIWHDRPVLMLAAVALLAGGLFGVIMAWLIARARDRADLTPWSDL